MNQKSGRVFFANTPPWLEADFGFVIWGDGRPWLAESLEAVFDPREPPIPLESSLLEELAHDEDETPVYRYLGVVRVPR